MSFIQPCFIRKNTPEIRKKLEEIGYDKPTALFQNETFGITTLYRDGRGDYIIFEIDDDFENIILPNSDFIDCGDNEELFLALAALRDDTPINSFYWFNRRLVKCEDKTEKHTFLNGFVTILKYRCIDDPNVWFGAEECFLRKATIEEIIEHFKK